MTLIKKIQIDQTEQTKKPNGKEADRKKEK